MLVHSAYRYVRHKRGKDRYINMIFKLNLIDVYHNFKFVHFIFLTLSKLTKITNSEKILKREVSDQVVKLKTHQSNE